MKSFATAVYIAVVAVSATAIGWAILVSYYAD